MTRGAKQGARAAALAVFCLSLDATAEDRDPWFGGDKLLHFGLSAGLAGGGYAASSLVFDGHAERAISGASFSLTLGAAKELYNLSGHGDPSWRDFTWDVIGTAVGVGIALVVDAAVGSDGARSGTKERATGREGMAIRF